MKNQSHNKKAGINKVYTHCKYKRRNKILEEINHIQVNRKNHDRYIKVNSRKRISSPYIKL